MSVRRTETEIVDGVVEPVASEAGLAESETVKAEEPVGGGGSGATGLDELQAARIRPATEARSRAPEAQRNPIPRNVMAVFIFRKSLQTSSS